MQSRNLDQFDSLSKIFFYFHDAVEIKPNESCSIKLLKNFERLYNLIVSNLSICLTLGRNVFCVDQLSSVVDDVVVVAADNDDVDDGVEVTSS